MEEKKTNVFAIVGLVTSIVFGGFISLILSIVGLKKSKELNDGLGMSIAGIIISVCVLSIKILVLVSMLYTVVIWPSIRTNILRSTYCSQAFDCKCNKSSDTCECKYCIDDDCSTTGQIQCPNLKK